MSTTGTYITDPTIAEYGDEAFERSGVTPRAITAEHIASLRRSIGFLLSSWSNVGPRQWKFATVEHTVTTNETSFDLPFGLIDVKTVMLVRDELETEMTPMSRSEYRTLHDKTMTGRPNQYFLNKRRGTQETPSGTPAQLFFWNAAENDTDIIVVEYYTQIQDAASSGMSGTLDIPFKFHEAFVSDLAARMAEKWNPKRYETLVAKAAAEFKRADGSDTEMAPLHISVSYSGRGYGRR